jgi:hypothetical protein
MNRYLQIGAGLSIEPAQIAWQGPMIENTTLANSSRFIIDGGAKTSRTTTLTP